jgi:hypothetical protein
MDDHTASLVLELRSARDDQRRYQLLDDFVHRWPATRAGLPAVLDIARTDDVNRGGLVMSLARLGQPLVPAVLSMVERTPHDLNTLLAAGAMAYQLVHPTGLTPRPDAEREAFRRGFAPLLDTFWRQLLTDTVQPVEILQGVAIHGEAALRRMRPPFPKHGASRLALVVRLILSQTKDEAHFPKAERTRLRALAAPLAPHFARALATAEGKDPSGEAPSALILGLSVLGIAATAAVEQEPGLATDERCPALLELGKELLEQFPPDQARPLAGRLALCGARMPDPELSGRAGGLLVALGAADAAAPALTRFKPEEIRQLAWVGVVLRAPRPSLAVAEALAALAARARTGSAPLAAAADAILQDLPREVRAAVNARTHPALAAALKRLPVR